MRLGQVKNITRIEMFGPHGFIFRLIFVLIDDSVLAEMRHLVRFGFQGDEITS